MKAFKLLLIFLLLLVGLAPALAQVDLRKEAERVAAELNAPRPYKRITGKVVGVHDGDTITVLDEYKREHKIRFDGIDAPELKQDFGNKAKQHLSDLVYGKQVTVVYNKLDKYGRTVGKVLLEGKDINYVQILFGYAWHYKKYQEEQSDEDRKNYAEAETKAKQSKLGLWAQAATPPWDWRAGVDNDNLEGVPDGAIIGNRNSMIYHTPGCSTYAKVKAENRAVFKTEEDAIKAGYRISGGCTSNLPVEKRPAKEAPVSSSNNKSGDKTYTKGPRGGCYYINSSGKKTYVDKSFCN